MAAAMMSASVHTHVGASVSCSQSSAAARKPSVVRRPSPQIGLRGLLAREFGLINRASIANRAAFGVRAQQNPSVNISAASAPSAEPAEPAEAIAQKKKVEVTIDNVSSTEYTVITVRVANRPQLLQTINTTFQDLGCSVCKAKVSVDAGEVEDVFYIQNANGAKLTDEEDLANVKKCLETMLTAAASMNALVRARPGGDFSGNGRAKEKTDLLYNLMGTYIKNDVLSIQESIVNHVEYTIARSRYKFDDFEAYQATAHSVRDRLIESWNDTHQHFRELNPKRVYYMSMEFLMGRSLQNCMYNLGIYEPYKQALMQLGYNLEELKEQEMDAALGNGGLGRLAACFLDSLACLNYPAWGYGIRYQYGMFRQTIRNGFQHEQPDYWLTVGNPWEIERVHITYPVKFYGHITQYEKNGKQLFNWVPGEQVVAVAYDNPIPGWNTPNTINLRLWAAKPSGEFDLESFNTGDYVSAILNKQRAETITSVLYPDDRTYQGKELRLKQQYFMSSASLQDIVRRFKDQHTDPNTRDWFVFADKVAIQLNDTHPTVSVLELMRILMDEEYLGFTKSWAVVNKVFSFTNHTVLPEALEKWPLELFEQLLPRHTQIVFTINQRFMDLVRSKRGDDSGRLSRMSIIEEAEGGQKFVRMANLACVASHAINGVAAIHSELIKTTIFRDFHDLWPEKFQNKTNGVTQRRWLAFCNPQLAALITRTIGTDAWVSNLDLLAGLREHADNKELHKEWQAVKLANKEKLAKRIEKLTGVKVNPSALFDIQVKRIHEYKRQLLNVLSVIWRYKCIKSMSPEDRKKVVPRVVCIGGKAAPGYDMAKRIIKLVSVVGDKVNNDPDVGDLLKVIFIPDYNVSLAETIIPASELSQHISTAGTEASGTSNMKFCMNGGLIIGTMDGANVEICEEIGAENMFIFGVREHEVGRLRAERRNYRPDNRFREVVNMIRNGYFGWQDYLAPVVEAIDGFGGDFYLLANDFPSYLDAQARVDATYTDKTKWTRMSILSTAGSGKFSSDRTIREYAKDIWGVEPARRPE
eukprot:jgi/Mesvir1/9694/Mv12172-RA.1